MNCSPTYYACENTVEFDSVVAWVSLPITTIHPRVGEESQALWILDTLHNREGMDNREVRHVSFKAIPILDSVDVEKAYCHTASCYHRQ